MRFDVCFIYHIKAVAVTKLIPVRMCRIMRVAHSIQVMLLHQANVFFHQFFADSTSQLRMFMSVSTFYQYRYPVDTETAILDFGSTETDFATGQMCYMPCIIFQCQYQRIKIRIFCTPTFYIRKGLFVKGNKITQATALDRYFIL